MRTIAATVFIFILYSSTFAQNKSDLRGPAYKNYKPWLQKSPPVVIYTLPIKTKLQGAAFKNYKPWQNKLANKYVPVFFGSERSKLQGPAYKNYKPWLRKRNKAI